MLILVMGGCNSIVSRGRADSSSVSPILSSNQRC
ncbi:unnamed protein product [Brassica oleracea var. botrytis]|uniref:(rape) hypothetical protein n=1 Tax=Brassica napus TaxID=3708 RepID=A0A816UJN2_BRANA|nr:unnamed protein product [Brassica napus]